MSNDYRSSRSVLCRRFCGSRSDGKSTPGLHAQATQTLGLPAARGGPSENINIVDVPHQNPHD